MKDWEEEQRNAWGVVCKMQGWAGNREMTNEQKIDFADYVLRLLKEYEETKEN